MNVRSVLEGCSSSQLARIAEAWGIVPEAGTLRRELVDLVATCLADGDGNDGRWAALTEIERTIILGVVRAGGRYEADLLARRLAREVTEGTGDDRQAAIERAAAGLVERGFLFRIFDADQQRRGVYLVLPDELLATARHRFGEGARDLAPLVDAAPELTAEVALAADLFTLASALRREAWGTSSRGLAGRRGRSVGEILARLRNLEPDGPGDPGRRWRFLLWLAQRAGWISRDAWPLPDDSQIEQLLMAPHRLASQALAAGPVAAAPGRRQGDGAAPVDSRRRQADALQLLGELGDGGWWSTDEVVGWLADNLEDEGAGPAVGRQQTARRHLEDQLRRWLVGRWYWVGLVRWGWQAGRWSLIAPTAALRSLTSGRPAEADSRPEPCTVGGALRLHAPRTADLPILYRAEQYLALTSIDSQSRGYILTPASFDRGVRTGGDGDELRGLLERLLNAPVPQDWLAALGGWSSSEGRLTLRARLLLSSDRPESLDEALGQPATRSSSLERISPHHAAVRAEDVSRLLTDLAQAGLPVEIDPGLRAEPSDAGRSAALANGAVETAWVALEVLRRIAPDVVAEQRDLETARRRLDAVLGPRVLEALDRRATSIMASIANRRRSGSRGRMA